MSSFNPVVEETVELNMPVSEFRRRLSNLVSGGSSSSLYSIFDPFLSIEKFYVGGIHEDSFHFRKVRKWTKYTSSVSVSGKYYESDDKTLVYLHVRGMSKHLQVLRFVIFTFAGVILLLSIWMKLPIVSTAEGSEYSCLEEVFVWSILTFFLIILPHFIAAGDAASARIEFLNHFRAWQE